MKFPFLPIFVSSLILTDKLIEVNAANWCFLCKCVFLSHPNPHWPASVLARPLCGCGRSSVAIHPSLSVSLSSVPPPATDTSLYSRQRCTFAQPDFCLSKFLCVLLTPCSLKAPSWNHWKLCSLQITLLTPPSFFCFSSIPIYWFE